ncbi:leucine-rich repeat-containing protein 57-like [Branchiostoma lanceolatum]|uniref:leucine-rich repeat-containing protein 57-like n=1 Tax=Branchiostoma lanceolatum TaxID=7740 RepID=UPI003452570D
MGNAVNKHIQTAEKTGVCGLVAMRLDEFPPELQRLSKNLRTLDVSNNKIAVLPKTIGQFGMLRSFTIGNNRLETLPEEFFQLKKLETLSLENNRIERLPPSVDRLTNLKSLSLAGNKVDSFPLALCKLRHLDALDLSRNALTEIPGGVGDLQVIELNLNQNQINNLPAALATCPRLKVLRVEENCLQLTTIAPKILGESKVSVLALEGNLFEVKDLRELEGYEKYMDRFTATRKKFD